MLGADPVHCECNELGIGHAVILHLTEMPVEPAVIVLPCLHDRMPDRALNTRRRTVHFLRNSGIDLIHHDAAACRLLHRNEDR